MTTQFHDDRRPDELYVTAVEYLLGLLEPEEAKAFTEQMAADESVRQAVKDATKNTTLLAEALPPREPASRVKTRFLDSIGSQPSFGALRMNEGKWRQGDGPGITYKKLHFDNASGLLTILVRMEPGAHYPAHRHSLLEQCLVLEGDLIHDGHVYGPGDFTWAEAGSIDPGLHTERGTLLLIIGAPGTEKI